jgi:hypothetical protein
MIDADTVKSVLRLFRVEIMEKADHHDLRILLYFALDIPRARGARDSVCIHDTMISTFKDLHKKLAAIFQVDIHIIEISEKADPC